MTDRSFKDMAKNAAEELGRVKDTLKVKAHLGSMEAEQAFTAVNDQLLKVSHQLVRAAEKGVENIKDLKDEDAQLQLHLGLMDARDRWENLRPHLVKIAQEVEDTGQATLDSLGVDRAKLQARLAEMDAEDAIKRRTEEAKVAFSKAGEGANKIAQDFLGEFKDALEDIRERLDK